METEFYEDDFEKFLKYEADKFKMRPSKKVWHGIYNDLHPGRRWPSVAVSLVFIFTLVIIGNLNTSTYHTKLNASLTPIKSNNSENDLNLFAKVSQQNKNSSDQIKSTSTNKNSININDKNVTQSPDELSANKLANAGAASNIEQGKASITTLSSENNLSKIIIPAVNTNNSANTSEDNNNMNVSDAEQINETEIENQIPNDQINLSVIQNAKNKITERAVIKNIKIKRNNLRLTYYLMPAISYRNFSSAKYENVLQKPMIGLEAGTHLSYRLMNQLQFTLGIQADYLRYRINASNTHPILASVSLDNAGQPYTYTSLSNFGNGSGNEDTKLKNYSVQASLPIGLLYTFAGNNNIKFNAEASFQPSFVITDNSYILSTNQKNYLTDADVMRTWNMSTNFGTFVSFKSNSLNWEIGPEIHYQLLSTYTNNYPFKEHLFNYGFHIGVSKILK